MGIAIRTATLALAGDVPKPGDINNNSYFSFAYSSNGHFEVSQFQFTNESNIDPVPGPIVGAGLPGLLALLAGTGVWRRKRLTSWLSKLRPA